MKPLRVDVIDQTEGFDRLEPEWDALVADSGADPFFLSWDWLRTWWTHFGASRRLSLVTVRDERQLLGIAPLAIRSWQPARDFLPRLEMLGSGEVGSDYLDLIVRRGVEAPVTAALTEALSSRRLLLHLPQMSTDTAQARELIEGLQQHGWRLRIARTDVCPYIPIAGETVDSYLTSLGASHRYNFRRRLRQLQREFDVRFERAESDDRRRELLEWMIAQHNARWATRGGTTAFCSPALVAFHHDLSRRLLDRGRLRLFGLTLNGRPVAVLYGFACGGKFYFYQSGFASDVAHRSVGLVMMGLSIAAAIDEGLREFDLLHGDERYKFLWARRSRAVAAVQLFPPSVLGTLSRAVIGGYRAARSLGRRVAGAPSTRTNVERDVVVSSSR